MKHLITIFIVLLTYSKSQAQFNYRYADLRIEFTSPDSGAVVYSPGLIKYQFKVINQGPDSLYPTDTISHSTTHPFNGTDQGYQKQKIGFFVAPGNSLIITGSVGINGREDVSKMRLFFKHAPSCYGKHPSRPLQTEFWDDVTKDNFDEVMLVHKVRSAGTRDIDTEAVITIYPNPISNGILNIETGTSKGLKRLDLIDVQGKTVTLDFIQSAGKLNTRLTNQTSGVYMLRLEFDGLVVYKRVVLL